MSLITLDPEIQPTVRSCQEYQSLPVRFTFPEVTVGHRPGWALGSSFILHELAICAIVLLSFVHFPSQTVLVRSTKVTHADHLVYLPVLGGGAEGNGHEGGLSGRFQKSSAPVPARASKGFSYPGPQPILSDPPSPDRINQTLLQPHLRKPPALPELVALPNIVHMANAEPAPLDVRKNRSVPSAVPKLIEPPKLKLPSTKLKLMPTQPDLPEFNPAEVDSRQIPKLALPVNAPPQPEPIKVQPEHASKIARKAIEPPKPDQFVTKSTRGKDLQTLVALSPMPALPGPALKIPAAEARASFGVSPLSNMKIVQGGPGSKTAGAPSRLASIGIR